MLTKDRRRNHYQTTTRRALSLAKSIRVPGGLDEGVSLPQGAASPEEKLALAVEHLGDCLRSHMLIIRAAEHILQDARAAVARCDSRIT